MVSLWGRISWAPVVFGLLLYFLNLLMVATRWRMIAQLGGFEENRLGQYFRYALIGTYFNLLLPTSIGGDAIKAFYLAEGWRRYPRALATVVVDRISGLWLLIVASGFAAILINFPELPAPIRYGAAFLSVTGLVGVVLLPWLGSVFKSIFPEHMFGRYTRDPKIWLWIMLLALAVQVSGACIYLMITKSLGLYISWSFLTVLYIFTMLVTALPISLNGIGLREGAAVFLFSQLHLPASVGIAFGMTYLLIIAIAGAVGWFVYFITPRVERIWA